MASGDPPPMWQRLKGRYLDRSTFRDSNWKEFAFGQSGGVKPTDDDPVQSYVSEAFAATLRAEEQAIMGAPVANTYAGSGLSRFGESVARMQEEFAAKERVTNRERGLAGLKDALRPLGIVDVLPGQYSNGVLPLTMVRDDGSRINGGITDFDLEAPEPLGRLKAEIREINARLARVEVAQTAAGIDPYDRPGLATFGVNLDRGIPDITIVSQRLAPYGVTRVTQFAEMGFVFRFSLDFADGHTLDVRLTMQEIRAGNANMLDLIEHQVVADVGSQVGEPPVRREIEPVAVAPYSSRVRRTL